MAFKERRFGPFGHAKEVEQGISLKFRETDSRSFELLIYEYADDDLPDRFETSEDGIMVILQTPSGLTNALPRTETICLTPLRLFPNSS